MAFPTLYEGANEDEFNGGRRSTLCRGHRNVVKIRPRLLCGNPIARWMRPSELTFICMELALQTRQTGCGQHPDYVSGVSDVCMDENIDFVDT